VYVNVHGTARRYARPAFHVVDQVDVVAGAWAVYVAHQAVTLAGFALGMRPTWR
jgi:hypothetical protein